MPNSAKQKDIQKANNIKIQVLSAEILNFQAIKF